MKKRTVSKVICFVLAIMMGLGALAPALTAQAAMIDSTNFADPDSQSGIMDYINDPQKWWVYVDGHYKYRQITGEYLTSAWVRYFTDDVDERWYVDKNGNMVASDYYQIDGLWYLFDANGKVVEKQWVQRADGSWLYSEGNGALPSGWKRIGGKDYLFDENDGTMKTGWVEENDTYYFLLDNGAKAYGWVESNGSWYYMNPNNNGKMTVGEATISGKKYLFDYVTGALIQ